ncbi:MAG: class I SAM-dependent methyltransferase [Sandaracinaceae bacterium]
MNDPSFIDRKREVPSDFDVVAPTYDLLTGMNPGYHRHLRLSAQRLAAPPGGRLLDLCCGTGISTEALQSVYPDARIVGLDASRGMLEVARAKRLLSGVEWIHGDAMDVRAAGVDGPFDGILMAYGIRNVPDPDTCLARLVSLLAPGATLCLHEYSVRGSRRSRAIWDAVCWGIIIPGGLLTARTTKIYRYLHESVRRFDSVTELEARMRRAGLVDVRTEAMDGWQRGILHSFLGRRP